MTGRERVLVLLKVLGAQRQVRLRHDAIEPIDGANHQRSTRRRRRRRLSG
jgi:hypothetical protein